jgi:mono/diheme cytochrome c family protein
MTTLRQATLGVAGLGLLFVLGGCPGDYEGGYERVPFRERTPLAMAAAPEPPPVVAGALGGGAATAPTAPAGVDQAMVDEGFQLFGTVCVACHGAGAAGSPAAPALNDADWIHIGGSQDEIAALIQTGVPAPVQFPAPMPPMGGGQFTAEQVQALAAYVFAESQEGP